MLRSEIDETVRERPTEGSEHLAFTLLSFLHVGMIVYFHRGFPRWTCAMHGRSLGPSEKW